MSRLSTITLAWKRQSRLYVDELLRGLHGLQNARCRYCWWSYLVCHQGGVRLFEHVERNGQLRQERQRGRLQLFARLGRFVYHGLFRQQRQSLQLQQPWNVRQSFRPGLHDRTSRNIERYGYEHITGAVHGRSTGWWYCSTAPRSRVRYHRTPALVTGTAAEGVLSDVGTNSPNFYTQVEAGQVLEGVPTPAPVDLPAIDPPAESDTADNGEDGSSGDDNGAANRPFPSAKRNKPHKNSKSCYKAHICEYESEDDKFGVCLDESDGELSNFATA